MTKLTHFDNVFNALPADRQANIRAKANEIIAESQVFSDDTPQQVTINLTGGIIKWLQRNRQEGQDLPTQINDLLDEAILNRMSHA